MLSLGTGGHCGCKLQTDCSFGAIVRNWTATNGKHKLQETKFKQQEKLSLVRIFIICPSQLKHENILLHLA